MALIGAGINTVKGIIDRVLNKKRIKKLETINSSEPLDLVSVENRFIAAINLKQTHHLHRAIEGASREELSEIETEIVKLMEDNIDTKRVELSSKKATQLDIANLLVTIQKFSTEAANEIENQNTGLKKFKRIEHEYMRRKIKQISILIGMAVLTSIIALLISLGVV